MARGDSAGYPVRLGHFMAAMGIKAGALAAFLCLLILSGCGMVPPRGATSVEEARPAEGAGESQAAERASQAGRFVEPGELDRLVDAKPIPLAAVKPVAMAGTSAPVKAATESSGSRGRFRIQVGAESDIDAAQAKKQEYERKLGGTVDVVFDAPYYKLRWGYFDTKQDADDKILEISEFNIQGFVIKQ